MPAHFADAEASEEVCPACRAGDDDDDGGEDEEEEVGLHNKHGHQHQHRCATVRQNEEIEQSDSHAELCSVTSLGEV